MTSHATSRECRVGQTLTLHSGANWKVDRLNDRDGRLGVGLVNPANPNHGTAFYADVLDTLVVLERPLPPPLEHRAPDCSICGTETNPVDGYFDCEPCGASWPCNDADAAGTWEHFADTGEQCGSTIQPFAHITSANYKDIRLNTYRCWLDSAHDGEHRNPDYGTWRDDNPHVMPAENPA